MSLFFVLLFICTHNTIASPPLLGKSEHPSPISSWLTMTNLRDLGFLKSGSMFGHFNNSVLGYISPYFAPLKPYLRSFWHTLHPVQAFDDTNPTNRVAHSKATPMDIINIFKTALMDEDLITQLKSTQSILGKRSAPVVT